MSLICESSIFEDLILVYIVPSTKTNKVRITTVVTLDISSGKTPKIKRTASYEQSILQKDKDKEKEKLEEIEQGCLVKVVNRARKEYLLVTAPNTILVFENKEDSLKLCSKFEDLKIGVIKDLCMLDSSLYVIGQNKGILEVDIDPKATDSPLKKSTIMTSKIEGRKQIDFSNYKIKHLKIKGESKSPMMNLTFRVSS